MKVIIHKKSNGWIELTIESTGIILEFNDEKLMQDTLRELLIPVGLPH
jgi:hypothetical protein